MKKEYIKPIIVGERFEASEYVAACVVGKCDITSGEIYVWDDRDGDGMYDEGEIGWPLDGNTACDSEDYQTVSGDIKRVTPVVCFNATCKATGQTNDTIVGWRFWGKTPGGWISTHVSSVKPTASNAS